MITIIASIKEEHWNRIKTGEKTLELRKTRPEIADGNHFKVLVYISGTGKIYGEFICTSADVIKEKDYLGASYRAIVNVDFMYKYAKGRKIYGWSIDKPVTYYEPTPLEKYGVYRAPQSWQYLWD